MITSAIKAGFVPTQRGDGEANFSCDWTDENVEKLVRLLRLRVRRPSIRVQTRSTEHLFKKKPSSGGGTRAGEGYDPGEAE